MEPQQQTEREAGWMDARPRSRAISALVQHAKAVFEERTDETALVAPISPSPPELIQTLVDNAVSATVLCPECRGRFCTHIDIKTVLIFPYKVVPAAARVCVPAYSSSTLYRTAGISVLEQEHLSGGGMRTGVLTYGCLS